MAIKPVITPQIAALQNQYRQQSLSNLGSALSQMRANRMQQQERDRAQQMESLVQNAYRTRAILSDASLDEQRKQNMINNLLVERRDEIVASNGNPADTERLLNMSWPDQQREINTVISMLEDRGLMGRTEQAMAPKAHGAPRFFKDGSVMQPDELGNVTITSPEGARFSPGDQGYRQAVSQAVKSGVTFAGDEAQAKATGSKVGATTGDAISSMNQGLRELPLNISKLQSIQNRLADIPTGSKARWRSMVGTFIPEARGADLEEATAMFGQFVLQNLSKIQGPITEKELDFIASMGPNVKNSLEGNRRILARALESQKQQLALHQAQKAWVDAGNSINDFDTEAFIKKAEQKIKEADESAKTVASAPTAEDESGENVGTITLPNGVVVKKIQ